MLTAIFCHLASLMKKNKNLCTFCGRSKFCNNSEIFFSNSINTVKYLLRANSYQHPLEFAADMRRIITETYRYTMPKDPLVDLAGKLQSEFEMCFAKIDFSVSSNSKLKY